MRFIVRYRDRVLTATLNVIGEMAMPPKSGYTGQNLYLEFVATPPRSSRSVPPAVMVRFEVWRRLQPCRTRRRLQPSRYQHHRCAVAASEADTLTWPSSAGVGEARRRGRPTTELK
jgi:hypothetical protein